MLEEKDLIPYQTSDIPPGPWLIFAPHPDDEVLGMGGSMALASKLGIKMEVVLMTGGEGAGDPDVRRQESLCAGEILKVNRYHFWSLPDRGVGQTGIGLEDLRPIMEDLKPETVFLPGIQEFHPDHRAASMIIRSLLQKLNFSGSVWFYEISRQNEANTLVDISPVLERKIKAIECYTSQLVQNDYQRLALGINAGRAYTLPAEVTYAEAFWACASFLDDPDSLTAQYNALYRYRTSRPVHDDPLVSVVVRTKNRVRLLHEAIYSIAQQSYRPVEIIVVNDAGMSFAVEDLRRTASDIEIKYFEHQTGMGRAAAANTGISEASGEYVCFLDDDDLFYPSALETLIFHAGLEKIVHARARCVTYGPKGETDPESIVFLGEPAELGRLILQNYIPFNTVCVPLNILKNVGPLDTDLEIYEDWDLMIRLASKYEMQFIDAVVSEYRILGSATYTGKGGIRKQKHYREKVLAKHLDRVSAADILEFVQDSVDKVVLAKERIINLLRDEVQQKENEKDHLLRVIKDKDLEITRFGEYVKELQSEITSLREKLTDKDARLVTMEDMTSVYSELSLLRKSLQARDNEVLSCNENLSALTSHLNTQLESIKEKDSRILDLNENLTALYLQLDNLRNADKTKDEKILDLQAEISDLKDDRLDLQTKLDAVFSSTSWKITRPVRKTRDLFRFRK